MDTKLIFVFAVIAFAGAVTADSEEFPGTCPEITPVSSFDIEKFDSQKWYLVEETDSDSDRCVNFEVKTKPENSIRKTGIEKDGEKIDETKSFTMTTPGILNVKDGDDVHDYVVMATDYDSFAVLYTCDNDLEDKTFDEDVFVFVHKDKMTAPDVPFAAAKAAIQGKGIKSTNFQKIDHSNCPDSA